MKSKKLLAAALAAVLTLAGCGTTVLSAEETKELLTLSQKTMATVESMAAEMTMEMDMSMGEETAETTTVAKILTQQNPLRMQMNLSATWRMAQKRRTCRCTPRRRMASCAPMFWRRIHGIARRWSLAVLHSITRRKM